MSKHLAIASTRSTEKWSPAMFLQEFLNSCKNHCSLSRKCSTESSQNFAASAVVSRCSFLSRATRELISAAFSIATSLVEIPCKVESGCLRVYRNNTQFEKFVNSL